MRSNNHWDHGRKVHNFTATISRKKGGKIEFEIDKTKPIHHSTGEEFELNSTLTKDQCSHQEEIGFLAFFFFSGFSMFFYMQASNCKDCYSTM